jgi:hypothetical protein
MSLLKSIPIDNIEISRDYRTSERAGAGGMFQVDSLTIKTRLGNIAAAVDPGRHYSTYQEVLIDLGIDPSIDVEDV